MDVFPVLIAALLLSPAPKPTFQETRRQLEGWHPLLGPGFEYAIGTTFPSPADASSRFLRLRLPAGASAWLNGARLTANREGDFDISDWLAARGGNRLMLAGVTAASATLISTSRVYVASQTFRIEGRRLAAEVLVRNTLENTVNAVVAVRGPAIDIGTTATVPPGVSQWVRFAGDLAAPPALPANLEISVEKEEEAMEGGYTFVVRAVLKP